MTLAPLASTAELEKIAKNILAGARAFGKFPTPVDEAIAYSELSLARGIDLSETESSLITVGRSFAGKVSRKILGIFDFHNKTIYLDHSQRTSRKNFIKLHETGHGVIPWQKDLLGFLDDEDTIAAEIKEEFEREASFFASAALFQLDRFDEESAKLPLSLRSARALGEKFGASGHAAIRRYVERSLKRCAVLVLHPPEKAGGIHARVRDYFESPSFKKTFGGLTWPEECRWEFPFVQDMQFNRKDHAEGELTTTTAGLEAVSLRYHFFNSTYNVFIFLFPAGEKNTSRVTILPARSLKEADAAR
jgi:Zn-dependent peptidase ImmA (M78 family)